MAMGVAGRVAEQLVTGEPSSGAADDLARVSRIARRMICDYGMSEALGGMTFDDGHDSRSRAAVYSEKEVSLIGDEARRLVDEARERAHQVLSDSREVLDEVARALLERETLSADDLEELVGRAPVASGSSSAFA